jgi:hypothetical protein
MLYLDELRALTTELESLNDRVQRAHLSRGADPAVPLVGVEGRDGDEDLVQLANDWASYRERWGSFVARYFRPGVDPHQPDA